MNTTNPDLAAAVERLRIAGDALRFLSEIQAETMKEASEALEAPMHAVLQRLDRPNYLGDLKPARPYRPYNSALALPLSGNEWRVARLGELAHRRQEPDPLDGKPKVMY
jgi:hypothetical protein